MQVQSLGQADPLEKGMATTSSILAWRIPRTEEPGRLQSIRLQRVRHSWSDLGAAAWDFYVHPYTLLPRFGITCCSWAAKSCLLFCDPMDYSLSRSYLCPKSLSMRFPRQESWSGLPFLLQGIFPIQQSNPCLLHCRWILTAELPVKPSVMTGITESPYMFYSFR